MIEMGVPQMAAYKSFFEKKLTKNLVTSDEIPIENSKSILNREIYEKYGTLDAIKKIIESDDNPNGEDAEERNGEIDAGTFGMSGRVLEMTEEEYQAELKRKMCIRDRFSVAVQAIAKAHHWDLAKMKENIINQYEKVSEGKVQLDETDAIKELNARIAEEYLFKDEKSIRLLATKNRNLAQKILDWIRETLSKLFGSQSSEAKSYTDQLRECEKLYRRAIEDAKADNNLDAQYMFGGLNAKEIPDGYEEAQNSTEDTETTWKKTGWVKKADGKWRFEIDDSKAQFNTCLLYTSRCV